MSRTIDPNNDVPSDVEPTLPTPPPAGDLIPPPGSDLPTEEFDDRVSPEIPIKDKNDVDPANPAEPQSCRALYPHPTQREEAL